MVNISMKAMLEAGVHFGHQTRRWNPKMGRFIFGERNNIHIIDLQKTVKELKRAYAWVKEQTAAGKTFLMIGTKKQAQDIVRAEAERIGMPYVSEKWLGGMLTNFQTIRRSIVRLEELEAWERDGVFHVLSKKKVSRLRKEMERLRRVLTGIRHIGKLPDAIFIVDPAEEDMAVSEAKKLHIPIVAICDTNCDPDLIDYPVPGNDDAARSIKLFCGIIADAMAEGKAEYDAARAPQTVAGAEEQMLAAEEAPVEEQPADGEPPSPEAEASAEVVAQEEAAADTGGEPSEAAPNPENAASAR